MFLYVLCVSECFYLYISMRQMWVCIFVCLSVFVYVYVSPLVVFLSIGREIGTETVVCILCPSF